MDKTIYILFFPQSRQFDILEKYFQKPSAYLYGYRVFNDFFNDLLLTYLITVLYFETEHPWFINVGTMKNLKNLSSH